MSSPIAINNEGGRQNAGREKPATIALAKCQSNVRQRTTSVIVHDATANTVRCHFYCHFTAMSFHFDHSHSTFHFYLSHSFIPLHRVTLRLQSPLDTNHSTLRWRLPTSEHIKILHIFSAALRVRQISSQPGSNRYTVPPTLHFSQLTAYY